MPPSYVSIHALIHWLCQNSHGPVTFQWLDPPAGDQAFNTWAFVAGWGGHFISKSWQYDRWEGKDWITRHLSMPFKFQGILDSILIA
jgi:hypothetical protein